MKIRFLGTGTSIGIPEIGCRCEVCTSNDPHDKRMRQSALVDTDSGERILIDCGPDFYQQMLQVDYRRIDGVLITHEHYDHTGGIDDLRPFCRFGDVDIWLDAYTAGHLRQRLPYFFREKLYPGVARLHFHEIALGDTFNIGQTTILPLRVMHGMLPILGYRLGPLGYITDMSSCPEETVKALLGETPETEGLGPVDTLVINALRFEPHAAHQNVEEAVKFAEQIGARQTRFIHFSHGIGLHRVTNAQLPDRIRLAYDGEELDIRN